MRVLGIDPGLTRCGVGVVDVGRDRRAVLVHVDVIRTPPSMALEDRVLAIARGVASALDAHRPQVVALERVFAQHNLRTVMGTAQASGVVLAAAAERGLPVALHTPSEVKAAVTGHGGAGKAQVGAMVARILGLEAAPRPADAADALALAICHAWRGRPPAAGGAASGTGESATPAQRAWAEAERASRRGRPVLAPSGGAR
ncbi:MAG: crossover junction endodeoxyribonuclease RuvC [Actinomycetales bacterium]|nr:crossover junction endodeoxyribonuclease RuvC [Actinomycetales bacterium]